MEIVKEWRGRLKKLTRFFTSWSYSRLEGYEQCPAKSAFKHLYKLPDPGSDAAERGSLIHTQGEEYVKAKTTPKKVPEHFKSFSQDLLQLRKLRAIAEVSWTFTRSWALTEWNNWNAAWCRMKIDVHYILVPKNELAVIDYKSGKIRAEKHSEQGRLYATGGLLVYPNVKLARVSFWYTDHARKSPPESYARAMLPELQAYWEKRAAPLLNDRRFAARPGPHCKWCPYSRSKNGPCKYEGQTQPLPGAGRGR